MRIHALLQSISFLIYIAAAACGVYLVRSLSFGSYSMWQDPHTKMGIAILVLAFIQPFLGLIHHLVYKRRARAVKVGSSAEKPGRTAPGYAHLWLGRILIFLGMINGGLGIRLASQSRYSSNSQTKSIAYGVGAGIMFLLYVAFIILGERRRSKERREKQTDLSRSGVPLVAHNETHPPSYFNPPTYEASQESIAKEGHTTARYS